MKRKILAIIPIGIIALSLFIYYLFEPSQPAANALDTEISSLQSSQKYAVSVEEEIPTAAEVANNTPPAFPGAQGHGALSIGGRGGQVIAVTNLNDSGPGSLRAAVEAEGPRTVVFHVAGIIEIQDPLDIESPYLTIAGQTAPGGGITIKGGNDHIIRLRKGVHNVIIRYLRLRHGSGSAGDNDNLNIRGGNDIIVDHLSLSWSTDENMGIYRDPDDEANHNITVQRTIMAEGLEGQSNGIQISGVQDYSDPNNPVEAWRENREITLHHNLFIHNTHRNPRVIAGSVEIINNVVYNWKHRIGSTRSASAIDYVGNYSKQGPMSNADEFFLYEDCSPSYPDWNCPLPTPSLYISGNMIMPNLFPDPTADNWPIFQHYQTLDPLPLSYRRTERLSAPAIPVSLDSAADAFTSVLNDVGANARLDCAGNWVPNIDIVDARLVADATNGTGPTEPIANPDAVGGYPTIDPDTPCPDTDGDGMPDEFETLQGFNPNDPADGSTDGDSDGYTNLEEYLNGTNPTVADDHQNYIPYVEK